MKDLYYGMEGLRYDEHKELFYDSVKGDYLTQFELVSKWDNFEMLMDDIMIEYMKENSSLNILQPNSLFEYAQTSKNKKYTTLKYEDFIQPIILDRMEEYNNGNLAFI